MPARIFSRTAAVTSRAQWTNEWPNSIETSEEGGVRYLHFGSRWIQGAMRIARPWALELEYTRDMMLALLLRPAPRWPRSVLLIGLGAASLPKFLYRHRPQAALTVVEIEPAVVRVATQSFRLPDDPRRLAIEIADGHDYVAATDRRFDLILVDGYDAKMPRRDAGHAGVLLQLPCPADGAGAARDEFPQSPSRTGRQPQAHGRGVRRARLRASGVRVRQHHRAGGHRRARRYCAGRT